MAQNNPENRCPAPAPAPALAPAPNPACAPALTPAVIATPAAVPDLVASVAAIISAFAIDPPALSPTASSLDDNDTVAVAASGIFAAYATAVALNFITADDPAYFFFS